MINKIIKRLLIAIPSLLAVITLVFLLVHAAPGNPFAGEKVLSAKALAALMHQYRLDLPLYQQYFYYLSDILHGSFGNSMRYLGQPITDLLFPDNMGGFWVTLRLSLWTVLFAVPLGIIVGSLAAYKEDSFFDRAVVLFNVLFNAIPAMVTGPVFVLIFAITLQWLPAGGWGDGGIEYLTLPIVVLVLGYAPSIAFVMRGSMLEVLNSGYIRTARAKGLPMVIILFRHAIRPAVLPVLSMLGPMIASILVGAVVTEQVFTLPGIGILTTTAALTRDYNLIMAIVIISSFITIMFNMLVDILYMLLDPKVK